MKVITKCVMHIEFDIYVFISFHYPFYFKLYSHICPPHECVKSLCKLYTRTRFFPLRFREPTEVHVKHGHLQFLEENA